LALVTNIIRVIINQLRGLEGIKSEATRIES